MSFSHSRHIAATPQQIFAAFAPERLRKWWGPAGFTNTFHQCDLKTGGTWSLTMHGPDGRNYPNESLFEEVLPPARVVVRHVSAPHFRLTITIAPEAAGSRVTWLQVFDDAAVAAQIADIVRPANEQNLDRLSAEVLG